MCSPPAPAPLAPSSPHTGATHGGRLRWAGTAGTAGATGCAALFSALGPPARGTTEEPRGRSGLPRPRRRLEARLAAPGRRSGRPLLGVPSGQPRGEGRESSTRCCNTSRLRGARARGETLQASLPALRLTSRVALGKSTNLSKPYLENYLNEPMIM